MAKLTKEEHAQRGIALSGLIRSDGWAVLLEEHRARVEAIRKRALDVETPAEETQALKFALKELEEISPEPLADQLIRRAKANG